MVPKHHIQKGFLQFLWFNPVARRDDGSEGRQLEHREGGRDGERESDELVPELWEPDEDDYGNAARERGGERFFQ